MTLSKSEKHMIKQDWFKLGTTIIIFYLWGDQLSTAVQGLDTINPIAANLIVFGTIGCIVYTLIAYIDKG